MHTGKPATSLGLNPSAKWSKCSEWSARWKILAASVFGLHISWTECLNGPLPDMLAVLQGVSRELSWAQNSLHFIFFKNLLALKVAGPLQKSRLLCQQALSPSNVLNYTNICCSSFTQLVVVTIPVVSVVLHHVLGFKLSWLQLQFDQWEITRTQPTPN